MDVFRKGNLKQRSKSIILIIYVFLLITKLFLVFETFYSTYKIK